MSRSFFQRLECTKRPGAAIFADLSKAFDRVLRPVVLGNPHTTINELEAEMIRCGVPDDIIRRASAYVQESGGVLHVAELHPAVLALLRDLHRGTWFAVPDNGGYIHTRLGSRQGCTC